MLQKTKGVSKTELTTPKTDDAAARAVVENAKAVLKNLESDGFKSAEELHLTKVQREALIKTLELLESGSVQHHKTGLDSAFLPGPGTYFAMRTWKSFHTCGTTCCIGGTADLFAGKPVFGNIEKWDTSNKRELHKLFYNWNPSMNLRREDPPPEKAAKVLRGYLETGVTDWHKAYA